MVGFSIVVSSSDLALNAHKRTSILDIRHIISKTDGQVRALKRGKAPAHADIARTHPKVCPN